MSCHTMLPLLPLPLIQDFSRRHGITLMQRFQPLFVPQDAVLNPPGDISDTIKD